MPFVPFLNQMLFCGYFIEHEQFVSGDNMMMQILQSNKKMEIHKRLWMTATLNYVEKKKELTSDCFYRSHIFRCQNIHE